MRHNATAAEKRAKQGAVTVHVPSLPTQPSCLGRCIHLTLHSERLNPNEPAPRAAFLRLRAGGRGRGRLHGDEPVLDAGAAAGARHAVDADVGAARGGPHGVQQVRVLAPRVPVRRVPDRDPRPPRVRRVPDQRREFLCQGNVSAYVIFSYLFFLFLVLLMQPPVLHKGWGRGIRGNRKGRKSMARVVHDVDTQRSQMNSIA